MTKILSTALALTLCTVGLVADAQAQPNGSIHGTVLDPSGALIPHAQVTISSADVSRTMTSDENGAFEILNLADGSYSIGVSALGFTSVLEEVQIAESRATEENVKLGISVEQDVEVYADAK